MSLVRLAALALGCALAAFIVVVALRQRERAGEQHSLALRRAAEAAIAEHARAGPAAAVEHRVDPGRPEERTFFLDERRARQLFPIHTDGQRYDPWCYFRHLPNLRAEVDWPEHPAGGWTFATNAEGLREDGELERGPVDLRLVVTGDSHAEGFCDNRDALAALLEADLARRAGGRRVDVINAADGGYTFQNYLGVIEEFRALAPAAGVIVVHVGNDFREALLPEAWFRRRPQAPQGELEIEGCRRGMRISPAAMTQAFFSLHHFRCERGDVELALDIALVSLERARRVLDTVGSRLLVVILPAPPDTDWPEQPEVFEHLRQNLALSSADLALHRELAARLVDGLAQRGIECLDAGPLLAQGGPYFWRKDLHLDLEGHRVLAAALLERLGDLVPPVEPPR